MESKLILCEPDCLDEMTEGDLIQIQSELNQDWVWIKNFRSNKVGCASKIYLCPVSWMHQYPYYVDRITLDSFYEYFLQTEPGTFFIETKNSEMLNIYVKLLKKKYLVKDINVMDNTFKCDEQLFFSLRELTEYYSISPLQDNQSLIKSIEKERLAFPSIYFVFPLDSNMKIIPLLEKPISIHSTKDILSHYFLYCLMDNKWEKYTYILDLYRRGLFLYPLNSAIIPDIIISLERFVIGAVHKSIVPSDFDNVFFIRDLDGIYSTYIYLCLENSEYSREFISLLESINNKNSCVLTKSYDMINSLKFNNELKRFVKTVQNIEIHLNCIELPSSVSMANFVNECVVCIDGVPVSKTRNVFVIKNKIIWDEKFSLNNTHIYECLEIHINKSPELSIKCQIKVSEIIYNQPMTFRFTNNKKYGTIYLTVKKSEACFLHSCDIFSLKILFVRVYSIITDMLTSVSNRHCYSLEINDKHRELFSIISSVFIKLASRCLFVPGTSSISTNIEPFIISKNDPYYLSKDIDSLFCFCIENYSQIRSETKKNLLDRHLLASLDEIMDVVKTIK
ncbi:hypothetical protein HZS_3894 [Henneguya salminicola]|nr:hypothetical protein HZS_3894 [Henneguya salminicola]